MPFCSDFKSAKIRKDCRFKNVDFTFFEAETLVFSIRSCPAIRYNLLGRTPPQKDFHCYRGYFTNFVFHKTISKRNKINIR